MNLNLFEDSVKEDVFPALVLEENVSDGWRQRTIENARKAELTVAFAVDFQTGGEQLTAKAAGKRYMGIPYGSDVDFAGNILARALKAFEVKTLNVAGNGLYTLVKHGVSQTQCNRWVFEVLAKAHAQAPLQRIRSGGQTGVDWAGLVSGLALEIPVLGLFPKNFRQRNRSGEDIFLPVADLERYLKRHAQESYS